MKKLGRVNFEETSVFTVKSLLQLYVITDDAEDGVIEQGILL